MTGAQILKVADGPTCWLMSSVWIPAAGIMFREPPRHDVIAVECSRYF